MQDQVWVRSGKDTVRCEVVEVVKDRAKQHKYRLREVGKTIDYNDGDWIGEKEIKGFAAYGRNNPLNKAVS